MIACNKTHITENNSHLYIMKVTENQQILLDTRCPLQNISLILFHQGCPVLLLFCKYMNSAQEIMSDLINFSCLFYELRFPYEMTFYDKFNCPSQWWNYIRNEPYIELQIWNQVSSYGRNFCNFLEKPQKVRTSTGFEPMTFQFRCTNQLSYKATKVESNCKNCVHNCEDHSLLDFISAVQ